MESEVKWDNPQWKETDIHESAEEEYIVDFFKVTVIYLNIKFSAILYFYFTSFKKHYRV